MGRRYAGVLGLLAFATTVARGVLERGDAISTLRAASLALLALAAVGCLVGRIAEWTIAAAVAQQQAPAESRAGQPAAARG